MTTPPSPHGFRVRGFTVNWPVAVQQSYHLFACIREETIFNEAYTLFTCLPRPGKSVRSCFQEIPN